MPPRPVLIMAGGTGGHVYPALAVADYLRDRGVPLYWLGTRQGLEARVVTERRYPLLTIDIRGLRGNGLLGWLLAPYRLCIAVAQAARHLLRCRPAVVLGMGGFVSGPGGVAAWLLRIPLVIHEQNAVAGLTNRLLAPLARAVLQGFPGSFTRGARTTGNPVRAEISGLAPPAERLAGRTGPIRLLVLGGSQGARALNLRLPAALAGLGDRQIEVLHQAGVRHLEEARGLYAAAGLRNVEVVPYIENMAGAYAWADLVLCRAGALTIAELCVAGLAAILVPYPFAVDDHQTANARHVSGAGGAVLLPEGELEALAALLAGLIADRGRLLGMAERSRALGRPEAVQAVGEICMEAARV